MSKLKSASSSFFDYFNKNRKDSMDDVISGILPTKFIKSSPYENEHILTNIINAAPIGVGFLKNRTLQWVNTHLVDMVGYEKSELINQSVRVLYVSEEEFIRVGKIIYPAIEKEHVISIDVKMKRKDGLLLDVLGRVSLVNPANPSEGVSFMLLDMTDRNAVEKNIRESEEQQRLILKNMTSGFALHEMIYDENGKGVDYRFLVVNDAFKKLVSLSDPEGKTARELNPDLDPMWIDFYDKVVTTGKPIEFEKYQEEAKIWWYVVAYKVKEGQFACIFDDITIARSNREYLAKLSGAVEQSPASIIIWDRQGHIEYVNSKFIETSGYTKEEVIGRNIQDFRSEYVGEEKTAEIWETLESGKEWVGELCNQTKEGGYLWEHVSISLIKNSMGKVVSFVAVKEDMSYRKEYEQQLEHQANFDALTDLPNRLLACDRLSQAVYRAHREHSEVGVMFIDLDQFKHVNDTLGHATGDKLLVEAASRLRKVIRESDTLARLGGDEFLIIFSDFKQSSQAEIVARKILKEFSEPFLFNGRELYVTASIGITIFPHDGTDASTLLKNADTAMYRAKNLMRNNYQFFTGEMNEKSHQRLELEGYLRKSLDNNELEVYYQPLIDIPSGQLVGAEALLRWNHPEQGIVAPDTFIPLAEETGMIVPIGAWVLEQACKQIKEWQLKLGLPMHIAVNVSTRQFKGNDLIGDVKKTLDKINLPAKYLDIEITENLLIQNDPKTFDILQNLDEMGVGLSIDDFGTGYSSLNYIKKYPFNSLKIDRSFVNDLMVDVETSALTKAIISMAHSLDLRVVAEGVETIEQLDYLKFQGCDWAQGYYFNRPLPAKEFFNFAKEYCKK